MSQAKLFVTLFPKFPQITSWWDVLSAADLDAEEHLMVTNFMQICSRALISVKHEQGCASFLNLLLLAVPMAKPSPAPKANTTADLTWNEAFWIPLCPPNLQIAFPAQRQGMRSSIAVIALPACGDKFLPMAQGSCASTFGRHTSPRSVGAELWRCWQTLACSFHAFQRSLIVFDVEKSIGWS